MEASEFRDARSEFDQAGVAILGCSGDSPSTLSRFKARHQLNFTLLSDPDFQVIESYGARRMNKFLGKTALGIVRSTVWIGPDGKIRRLWNSVKSKGHAAEVLEAVRGRPGGGA